MENRDQCKRSIAEIQLEEQVKDALRSGLALATTGAAAGVAVTKLTGHSKTLGAVAGISVNLLLYGILRLANRHK